MYCLRVVLCTLLGLLGFCSAFAAQQTVEAEHTYIMGDRDSKAVATRLCYTEAERKAVEQAGVYMESQTRIQNFSLVDDEVRNVTAAIVRVEQLGEEVRLDGQHMSVHCRSRVSFDPQEVLEQLKRIADNAALRRDLADAGRAVDSAQAVAGNLQAPEAPVAQVAPLFDAAPDLQTDVAVPAPRSDDDARYRALNDLDALKRKRDALVRRNTILTKAGTEAIAKGMSSQQVHELLGDPQARLGAQRAGRAYACERYGTVWVVFQDDAALCLRKQLETRTVEGVCSCAGSVGSFVWR